MFCHLILGLLREGQPRHGYELISHYRQRSGLQANPGNFYRELSKLAADRLIELVPNGAKPDPRRISYCISEEGRAKFDSWLLDAAQHAGELNNWLLFAHLIPVEEREPLLDGLLEELWILNKTLLRARNELLTRARRSREMEYNPAALLLLRRSKQVAADLEFLEELRRELKKVHAPAVTRRAKACR